MLGLQRFLFQSFEAKPTKTQKEAKILEKGTKKDKKIMARIVSSDEVATAAHRLQHGLLVAFPTETVYGLGANAFDHDSCLKIFAVKGRPTTDPLICHVATVEQATALWDCEDAILHLATFLGAKFWPGPLTLVSKASVRTVSPT